MTAPLAALPPATAPSAAPFAAPLAFSPLFFSGWVCAAGGGVDFAGSVCANAVGNIALIRDIAVPNPMTLSECFTWPPFRLLCSDSQDPLRQVSDETDYLNSL